MDWRGGGGTTEGRRLKSLKMLFTRNSIIDAAAEEEEGEMEVLPSEGAKSAQIPILGYLEGGQNQKITWSDWSVSMEEGAASGKIQETVGLDGMGNEMMTKLSPVKR